MASLPYHCCLPILDPANDLARALKNIPYLVFLDSSDPTAETGRYSLWAMDPLAILSTHHGTTSLTVLTDGREQAPVKISADGLTVSDQDLKKYRGLAPPEYQHLPFLGGWVGFASYEWRGSNPLTLPAPRHHTDLPEAWFACYDTFAILDHQQKCLHLMSWGRTWEDRVGQTARAEERVTRLMDSLGSGSCQRKVSRSCSPVLRAIGSPPSAGHPLPQNPSDSNFSKKDYLAAIQRILKYIRAGDCYQVNLSQRFTATTSLSAVDL